VTEHKPTDAPQQSREWGDPTESVRPLPKSVHLLMWGAIAWGTWYLATSTPEVTPLLGDARSAAGFAAPPAASGAQLFAGKCAACHQATGQGVAGVFPPLVKSEWVIDDERVLAQILLHGIQGPIEVNGQTYNGLMPPWKALSDDELAAIATYIRASWGNGAPAVTAATFATERARTADRTTAWGGGAELQAFAQTP
jgi:mono/diheme cytochrome c family protein